jgi:hypothetical protein
MLCAFVIMACGSPPQAPDSPLMEDGSGQRAFCCTCDGDEPQLAARKTLCVRACLNCKD